MVAWGISGAVGCDARPLVKCSAAHWRANAPENFEQQQHKQGMRVTRIPPETSSSCSSSAVLLRTKRHKCHHRRPSSFLSFCPSSSQMLSVGASGPACCCVSRYGNSLGVSASHPTARISSTPVIHFTDRSVDGVIGGLLECRNPLRWGLSLKSYSQRLGLRVCCAGEGDGDKKEGGGSVGTTEKEPERPESSSNSSPSENMTPVPPPSGDGELNVLPHAFSFVELIGPEKVDPEDVKKLKENVFGYSTFWITGQEPFGDLGEGVLLLGNLRGKREDVYAKLQRRLREVMGTKYDLFMVEEPNAEEEDPRGGPRVSFVLQRHEVSDIGPTTLWQYIVAVVLFLLTGGTCLELGISSQVSRLPPEVVQYITNPETTPPPDLQVLVPYVDSALPLAYGVFGVQILHELGHRLAAAPRNVKLGIPYFIPNITLGSFGSITQFRSICPDRQTKFDISLAGPLAGGFLSLAMFGVGLILSTNSEASSQMVQVPSLLLQGSLLLGLVSRGVLGYSALHAPTVAIHPLVIAGWCGLTTTAFNLLPVGCLDGGRAMQAALGRGALNISGIITYLLLGLGVLGGPLSLPWGLYILIAQRSPEKPCLNDVTEVGTWRKTFLTVITLLVVATLLPVWDELAEELGIGIVSTLQPLD